MPPAVAPGPKVRGPVASVLVQDGWDLVDAHALQAGFDHHLASELHPRGAQPHALVGVLSEGAQAAMEVTNPDAEEEAADRGQDRVADKPMTPAHRALVDPTTESVAHHEVRPLPKFRDKRPDRREVITVIGGAHHDVLVARR